MATTLDRAAVESVIKHYVSDVIRDPWEYLDSLDYAELKLEVEERLGVVVDESKMPDATPTIESYINGIMAAAYVPNP